MDALVKRSQPYTDKMNVPGAPGGAFEQGQYLLTRELAPGDLPYLPRPRVEKDAEHLELPDHLQGFVRANVTAVTNVILVSGIKSGSLGLVRLCEADGEPVAAKTYPHDSSGGAQMLAEARSAKLLSDLGIGPRFRGVFQEASGGWNVVTDIVPGDFRGMPVTDETLADCEGILARLRAHGIEKLGDLQAYRTPEGRLLVIDGGALADSTGVADSSGGKAAAAFRAGVLSEAGSAVARRYLQSLSRSDPRGFEALSDYLLRLSHLPHYQVAVESLKGMHEGR